MKGYLPNLLITGSSGFIGSNLTSYLSAKNYSWEGWSLSNKKDIFDEELEQHIRKSDVVVHLAALTSVENSFKDPLEYMRINILGTAKIVYLCNKYKKKLIYPSTAAIYHADLSPYAKSKAIAENIVESMIKSFPVTIFRFQNVFGSNMNPNSGSIMYSFLTNKRLIVYGDGEQTRDYIHVDDVVRIIEDSFKKKWDGEIVDVGMGQAYSVNYVAGLFSHFRNIPIEYEPPRREIKWSIADTAMLKTLYKKPLTTNLELDIQQLCQT
mgnify:CR=1 FL=1